MKKVFLLVSLLLIFAGCENEKGTFIETAKSPYTTKEGIKKFEEILKEKGLSVFHIIDHAQNAKHSDMKLLPNTLVVFGNPKMETVLMQCNPTMGMDLPLKMVFYTDYAGTSWISYTNPEYYTLKHNIKDTNCLAVITKANKALQTLSDALIEGNTTIQVQDVNIIIETKDSK